MEAQTVIDQMPASVLTKVEEAAYSAGISTEEYVDQQIQGQITEEQLLPLASLDSDVDSNTNMDYNPTNNDVTVGVRIRF